MCVLILNSNGSEKYETLVDTVMDVWTPRMARMCLLAECYSAFQKGPCQMELVVK
jgi:hypothetical protein